MAVSSQTASPHLDDRILESIRHIRECAEPVVPLEGWTNGQGLPIFEIGIFLCPKTESANATQTQLATVNVIGKSPDNLYMYTSEHIYCRGGRIMTRSVTRVPTESIDGYRTVITNENLEQLAGQL